MPYSETPDPKTQSDALLAYYAVNMGNAMSLSQHFPGVEWECGEDALASSTKSLTNAAQAILEIEDLDAPLITTQLLAGVPPHCLARIICQGLMGLAEDQLFLAELTAAQAAKDAAIPQPSVP